LSYYFWIRKWNKLTLFIQLFFMCVLCKFLFFNTDCMSLSCIFRSMCLFLTCQTMLIIVKFVGSVLEFFSFCSISPNKRCGEDLMFICALMFIRWRLHVHLFLYFITKRFTLSKLLDFSKERCWMKFLIINPFYECYILI